MADKHTEIRVCGLQRSGNHAIINWIIDQYKDKRICFLNNVKHGDYNPFIHAGQVYAYGMDGFPDGQLLERVEQLQSSKKDVLIYSYEDSRFQMRDQSRFLSSVHDPTFEKNRERYFGESGKRLDVLIVRDPYNLLASRLQKQDELSGVKDTEKIIAFWQEIANRAIEFNNAEDELSLVVNYNRWFSDLDYRKALSASLGGKFTDSATKKMSSLGGGSSFDGTQYGSALTIHKVLANWQKLFQPSTYQRLKKMTKGTKSMKVLERWKNFETTEQMQQLLENKAVRDLSNQLFEEIPGIL